MRAINRADSLIPDCPKWVIGLILRPAFLFDLQKNVSMFKTPSKFGFQFWQITEYQFCLLSFLSFLGTWFCTVLPPWTQVDMRCCSLIMISEYNGKIADCTGKFDENFWFTSPQRNFLAPWYLNRGIQNATTVPKDLALTERRTVW